MNEELLQIYLEARGSRWGELGALQEKVLRMKLKRYAREGHDVDLILENAVMGTNEGEPYKVPHASEATLKIKKGAPSSHNPQSGKLEFPEKNPDAHVSNIAEARAAMRSSK